MRLSAVCCAFKVRTKKELYIIAVLCFKLLFALGTNAVGVFDRALGGALGGSGIYALEAAHDSDTSLSLLENFLPLFS